MGISIERIEHLKNELSETIDNCDYSLKSIQDIMQKTHNLLANLETDEDTFVLINLESDELPKHFDNIDDFESIE